MKTTVPVARAAGHLLHSVALSILLLSSTSLGAAPPVEPVIETRDVARFYRVYDAAHRHPTALSLQRDYIDAGSPGLRHLARIRNVTGDSIAKAVLAHPEVYSDAKRCMAVLPQVRSRATEALRTLRRLYPAADFPPVTIAISRGKPVGVADSNGVVIGLEALCAVNYLGANVEDRFVHTIAHEFAHVQQALKVPSLYNDPTPTVLESSLVEGAADFTGALISGESDFRSPYAPPNPADYLSIEKKFVTDEDKTDLSDWIDNGTLTQPGDLGYWVGYLVVKSYYDRATDKREALREILEMSDPKSFLAKSGWHPGIRLK